MNNLKNCAGKFITFEGVEGVGKSTQITLVAEALQKVGVETIVTREPGGTQIAEEIRNILLTHHTEVMTPIAELLLLFASRAQHIASVISPALKAGSCVLCDRFTDATYAYQGGGRGISSEKISQLENLVQGDLRPDFTILLDGSDVESCLKRAKGTGAGDRIEAEKLDFFERSRKIYLARANSNAARYSIISAANPILDVQQQVIQAINEKFSTS